MRRGGGSAGGKLAPAWRRLLWGVIGWLFLAISVLLLGHSIYALVESLRQTPPRKGRALLEGVWAVLLALLVLWNLRALGIIQFPLP